MPAMLGRIEAMDDPPPRSCELTSEEADRLRRFARFNGMGEWIQAGILNGTVLGGLAWGVGFVLWRWLAPVENPWAHQAYFEGLGLAVGLCCAIVIIWPEIGPAMAGARNLKSDVAGGVAHTLDLEVVRAVEIEEYEDEGLGFFLELADGRILCLISQDLYDYASEVDLEEGEEDRPSEFPQTRIRYRYAPHSGWLLDLTGIGEPLRPFGKVKSTRRFFQTDKQTRQRIYTGPEDGMVYEGPLEATLAAFKYKLQLL